MELTRGQQRYIRKNFNRKSPSEIAKILQVSESLVAQYIHTVLNQKTPEEKIGQPKISVSEFSFRNFFIKYKYIFLFFAVLVGILYVNSLGDGFVSDDNAIVSDIKTWTLGKIFSQPLVFLRGLLYFTAYNIAGLNPGAFRLISIIFHLGSVWLVFIILAILYSSISMALIVAGLFAVHPILVESITWISGGVYVQYSFFFLLAFLFYILSKQNKKYFIASCIAYLLALFSSEKAIVLFLMFILYEFSFGSLKKNWKKLLLITSVNSIWILHYIGKVNERLNALEQISYQQRQVYNPFVQVPIAIVSYLKLLIWPDQLTLYHSELFFTVFGYIIHLLLFIAFVGFIIYSYFKKRSVFFWGTFFFIALLPTLNPLGLSWIVAERYVYLGTIGIFAIVALYTKRFFDNEKWKYTAFSIFSMLLILFSIRTIVRNIDWTNEDVLWAATAKTSPSTPNSHNNMEMCISDTASMIKQLKSSKEQLNFNQIMQTYITI